jgi:hypothetical protein
MPIRLYFCGFQKDYIYQPQLYNSIQKINGNITEATVAIKHVLKYGSFPFVYNFIIIIALNLNNVTFKGQKELHVSVS